MGTEYMNTHNHNRTHNLPLALALALTLALALLPLSSLSAILFSDDFTASNEGWGDRDAGEMSVSWTGAGGFGNPAASGSMQGTFAVQGAYTPETDAFRLAGLGDLWGTYAGYSLDSFTFDFYSDDVLPLDLIFRISDGINTFSKLLSSAGSLDAWAPITVSLNHASGWLGGGATAFSNALGAVTFVDIQVSRNGASAQDFFFDNFALNGTLGGGGGPSAIPEPGTGLLVLGGMMLLAYGRSRIYSRKA